MEIEQFKPMSTLAAMARMTQAKAMKTIMVRPLFDLNGPVEVWEVGNPWFSDETLDTISVTVECTRHIAGRRKYNLSIKGQFDRIQNRS